jgi:hypothetical protein
MKKLTFTLQVFGLMAIVPIFVILEMSHETGKLPGNNNDPVLNKNIEKTVSLEVLNSEVQSGILYPAKYAGVMKFDWEE